MSWKNEKQPELGDLGLKEIPINKNILLSAAFFLAVAGSLPAAEITVQLDQQGVPVSPTLYGVFFEDINRAGDGGLYAEMIQNRSFEDSSLPLAWTALENNDAQVAIELDRTAALNAHNPTSLKIQIGKVGADRVGIFNQGFKGIKAGKVPETSPEWIRNFENVQKKPGNGLAVEAGKEYLFSLFGKAKDFSGSLQVSLETQQGEILAKQSINGLGEGWKKFEGSLSPNRTENNTRLVISTQQTGTLWIDMVSLFPKNTYKSRPNGMRFDLMQMMLEMKPGLLRFPGGSFSEGHVLADAWRWKETIGDVAERPGNWNIWGYRSTDGLGFHEYLQLAEDLGAEPLYVAHVGMAEKDFVSLNQLEPWIQDVLDAIEYANGPATSKWGALRAKNGHPEPFHLKYVEIGNENGMAYHWGGGTRGDYLPRYKPFYDRIKATYPDIVTIANIHTEPDVPADLVDEHYYHKTDWFFKSANLYDNYDRKKPRIYVGEYAAKGDAGNGNMRAALAEAAFMTGMERNSDVVLMSSYAPLFNNPSWQGWMPNAIIFDNTRVFGTPSYHVQAMFAANRPDVTVPLQLPESVAAAPTLFAAAGLKKDSGDLILKVVNSSDKPEELNLRLQGLAGSLAEGVCLELSAAAPGDENSFDQPDKIVPKKLPLASTNDVLSHTFPPFSVTVLRWSMIKK